MSMRCVLVLSAFMWMCVASTAAPSSPVFPEATLERAFEGGCSLVIAEILEVHVRDRMYYCRTRIVRTIIAGDMEKEEVHEPMELSASILYGTAPKPGSFYVMFIWRHYPYEFAWDFRGDVVEVDPSDETAVRRLVETADRVYAGTAIRRFRRTKPRVYLKPPDLSEELASLGRQFREQPGRRTEIAREIIRSDLGSRLENPRSRSSDLAFLPPKISLSRQEILSLLGEPTWRSGWTYSWRCDDSVPAREDGDKIGILSVRFDQSERAIRVLLNMQERSKWIRPATRDDWFAKLDGDPGRVARAFLEALRQSDWGKVLSFCSPEVVAKAREFDSAETFFRRFVPVEQLAAVSQYRPRGYSGRDGKTVEVSAQVSIETSESKWPLQWTWRLVRTGPGWLVDFDLVPLQNFIQKELIKSEMINDSRARRRWQSHEGIRYVLTVMADEFVIGQPMLLRLEGRNEGSEPVGYTRTSAMVNDPLLVTGPDGEMLPYMDTSYQTMVSPDVILPGEVVALADAYDVTSQYHIVRPGRYTFQWRGRRPDGSLSNTCEVDVKPGPLADTELIVETLLPVLPDGWRLTRHLGSRRDDDPTSAGQLYIHLIGQLAGKGGDKGVLLMIPPHDDPAETDPWQKEHFDLWGLSPWGPVYARVNEADSLWPNHKTEIERVLRIEPPSQP